jgi:putative transposase
MADDSMVTFDALLSKTLANGNPEFLRQALLLLTRQLMEMEVTQRTGATKHERSEDRTDYRNGHRQRRWDTRAGTLDLAIPKLRKSGYIPAFLEPRRRGERALVSVIQEAYVAGVSTRKVEGLLHAMGLEGISKSEVSRACEELDAVVQGFRSRSLESRYPYLWLDARYEKVRIDSRVVSNAVVIAYGVKESGEREVLGADVGPSGRTAGHQ